MLQVYTVTERRPEIAEVWHHAVKATLRDANTTVVCYQAARPVAGDIALPVPQTGPIAMLQVQFDVMPKDGPRVFLEEDVIPVRPWSFDDYPGAYRLVEGSPGKEWPNVLFARGPYRFGKNDPMIPQRMVRKGGCPDWLPQELCQPALDADAQVLGDHFLHIDKAYQDAHPCAAAKNALLDLLRQRYTPSSPSFVGKVMNFAGALRDHIQAGMPMATEEQIQARYAICQACEYLKNDACTKCGCPISGKKQFISKLSWADSQCPVGKWGTVTSKET